MELRLSAHILFLPPFFLFMNIKCHTLRLALPFLCCSVYLMSLGILAPGVITCWQFYSSWFLLGAGSFSGLMVGQGRGKLAWIAVRGASFGWSGWVSLGFGWRASNVSLGFLVFPTSALYCDRDSSSAAAVVSPSRFLAVFGRVP